MSELPVFTIHNDHFEGTLPEALNGLRREKLSPQHINVLDIVKDYLNYYHDHATRNLEGTSQLLPQLAAVIELKTRLLLPQAPKTEEEAEEEIIQILENLEALDNAITFLRERREERSHILPARVNFTPKASKPIRKSPRQPQQRLQKLLELASRYQKLNYFELTRERLTMPMALRGLRDGLRNLKNALFRTISPKAWHDEVVYFSAVLEMVKGEEIIAKQHEPFSPIQLELLDDKNAQK